MSPRASHKTPFATIFKLCLITLACVFIGQEPVWANQPIDNYVTSNVAGTPANFTDIPYANLCDVNSIPGCLTPGNDTNLTFGSGSNIQLNGLTVGGVFYEPATTLTTTGSGLTNRVVFRRAGITPGTGLTGTEQAFWEFDTLVNPTGTGTGSINLRPNNAGTLAEAMLSRTINRGIDNTFNNSNPGALGGGAFQETRNNIERIDYIIDNPGIPVPAAAADRRNIGFAVLERNGNDPFRGCLKSRS